MSHPILSMSPKEREAFFRRGFRLIFEDRRGLPCLYKDFLSDEKVAELRNEVINDIQARGVKVPIQIFDLWVRILREEVIRSRPEQA